MQFLLTALNAKYIHSNPAIYSLRGYLEEELKEHVSLGEYTINNSVQEILADIYLRKPDVIGFSCYIWNIRMIKEIIVELHKLLPSLPIWLGGPEVTYGAENIWSEFPMVTGIMIGEGEETFRELLKYYLQEDKEESELNKIAGLCLKTGYTNKRELTDLSKIPFLYEELDHFKNRILYYESSRGCPFSCSYCLSSIDKKVRLRKLEVVKKELEFFLQNKVKQVKFIDRTFNCNHTHAKEIWQYIHENDNGVTNFHFEISADLIDEEEISILNKMRPGLVQLEIGVQSTHPETIHAIRRTMNIERLREVVDKINKGRNIHQHLDLIAGLPFEDYDTFGESFNQVYDMKPEQLQLGFLKVLKGSYMHEMSKEYGIVYLEQSPYEVLYSKWLPYEKVLQLKKIEEMVEIYYNSNQFVSTLKQLVKEFATPFEFYETLAFFYEKKGYFVQSPARAYRYQVLLDFISETIEDGIQIWKELLTFDMYLRENLKSRPTFLTEIVEDKEARRSFFMKEAEEHCYLSGYEGYDYKQISKMTHLEKFNYSFLQEDFNVKRSKAKPMWVLFDYKNRNPLTNEARIVIMEGDLWLTKKIH